VAVAEQGLAEVILEPMEVQVVLVVVLLVDRQTE
jgi:hypothetical protein